MGGGVWREDTDVSEPWRPGAQSWFTRSGLGHLLQPAASPGSHGLGQVISSCSQHNFHAVHICSRPSGCFLWEGRTEETQSAGKGSGCFCARVS